MYDSNNDIYDFEKDLHFYSNACHVCHLYGKNIKLKRCSNCRMIAYCGRQHQKSHWPCHKHLCRILGEIVRRTGTVFGTRDKAENSAESWTRAKTNLILLIQIKLGRKLSTDEKEMLQFPRSCEICHETDPGRLVDCPDCPMSSFCPEHPRDNKHSVKCETSKLVFEIENVRCNPPDPILSKDVDEGVSKNMYDVIRRYNRKPQLPSSKLRAAFVSEFMTRPYTFLHAMEQLDNAESTSISIHVIGANNIELRTLAYWEILLHRRESLDKLEIFLIGPELCNDAYRIPLCEHCTARNSEIHVETIGDFYANYAASERFVKPNYIAGFNLGIHEYVSSDKDTWAPSLQELAKQDCPFFMTSYTLQESKEEQERLNRVLGRRLKCFYNGNNPFSSLSPYRDLESQDFFYPNNYLTIYEKLY